MTVELRCQSRRRKTLTIRLQTPAQFRNNLNQSQWRPMENGLINQQLSENQVVCDYNLRMQQRANEMSLRQLQLCNANVNNFSSFPEFYSEMRTGALLVVIDSPLPHTLFRQINNIRPCHIASLEYSVKFNAKSQKYPSIPNTKADVTVFVIHKDSCMQTGDRKDTIESEVHNRCEKNAEDKKRNKQNGKLLKRRG